MTFDHVEIRNLCRAYLAYRKSLLRMYLLRISLVSQITFAALSIVGYKYVPDKDIERSILEELIPLALIFVSQSKVNGGFP